MPYTQEIDKLLTTIAAAGGHVTGLGLADEDVVKAAAVLGLIEVTTGNGWTLVDTVSLAPQQRLQMGLPPVVRKPSAIALAMHAVAAKVGKIFGNQSPT
ncbi:hypothetical protein [Rhizobium chutanense]|uniref:hypothetical protein n=1 Tax=Rhizobium chutanense TaxID=2035448 RepID=UPI001179A285|nr:hypothetical protein [Rhizobium chutanense]